MEMSISFKTGTQMTNLKHNNRELTEWEYEQPAHKHIQRENSQYNIIIRQESLDKVYQEEFGQALEEYNAKQKRADRKIKDYKSHVYHSKTLDLQREFIIALGSKEDWDSLGRQDKQQAGEKLADYIREFEVRHPQLRIFNAVVHLDEAGAPHAHFNIVPVAEGYKNGLKRQPSFSKALTQEGNVLKGKAQYKSFREKEVAQLEQKLKELGHTRKLVGKNHIKDIHEYKEMVTEVSEKRQELEELSDQSKTLSNSVEGLKREKNALEDVLIENKVKDTTKKVLAQLESDVLLDLGLEYTFRGFDLDKNNIKFGRHGMFGKEEYAFIPKSKWDKIVKLINDRPFVVAYNRFKELTEKYVVKFKNEINRLNSVIYNKNKQLELKDNLLEQKEEQIKDLTKEVNEMIPYYNDSLINHEVLQELGYQNGFDDAVADLVSLCFQNVDGNKLSFSEAKEYVVDLIKNKSKESGIKPPLRNYNPRKGIEKEHHGPSL